MSTATNAGTSTPRNAPPPPTTRTPASAPADLGVALDTLRDDSGQTLRQITNQRPTLVVLLRHAGCTFCRQTLADLAAARSAIAARNLSIVVIGMTESTKPMRLLGERYALTGVLWIADPDRLAYKALQIGRGSFLQLLGPWVIWSGLRAALKGHGLGLIQGDPFQMPGTAIIHRGTVVRRYVHQTAADRPDLEGFACDVNPE